MKKSANRVNDFALRGVAFSDLLANGVPASVLQTIVDYKIQLPSQATERQLLLTYRYFPETGYHALWMDIASHRNNAPSPLSALLQKIDLAEWPGPVILLFVGKIRPADVLAAADSLSPEEKAERICQANFYIGEFELLRDAKEEATRWFRTAVKDCPRDVIERSAANAELKALDAKP